MVMKKIFKYMMALTAAFAIVACSDKIEPPTEENPGNEQNPGDNTGGGEGGEQDPPVPATPTYYVTVNGTGTGASWADAASLTAALETAESGAIINVAAGTYVPEKSLLPAVEEETTPEDGVTPADAAEETPVPDEVKGFNILKPVTIVGGFPANPTEGAVADPAANETILDGQNKSYHVVFVAVPKSEGEVVLKGITVTRGSGAVKDAVADARISHTMVNDNGQEHDVYIESNNGGGIAAMSSKLKMENVKVVNNDAWKGAEVFALNTDLDLKNCEFSAGESDCEQGFGILAKANENYVVNIKMDGCKLNNNVSNRTRNNGALVLLVDNGTFNNVTISNSEFVGNVVKNGSAIYANSVNNFVIRKTLFKDNSSAGGNGTFFYESKTSKSTVLLEDCVFENNNAASNGTAMTADLTGNGEGIDLNVVNCAFVNNTTGQRGPFFLRSRGASGSALNAKYVNCTFSGNTGGTEGGSAICIAEDTTPLNVDVISCTFTGNDSKRQENDKMGAIYVQSGKKTTLNIYNSIVSGNTHKGGTEDEKVADVILVSGATTVPVYKSSIIGDKYYNAAGAETTVTPAFAYATMLSAAAKVGDTYVCKLVGNASSNPAFGNGATLAELGALATETVTADVLKKDQTGAARTDADKVIGAYVAK